MARGGNAWLLFPLVGLLASSASGAGTRIRRNDAEKYTATTIEEMPYLQKVGETFEGFIPDMMDEIKKLTKSDFELKLVADNRYGQQDSSGNWNGMIGEILKDEADLAAAPMTISDARKEVVSFTTPFMTFDTTLLMKKGGSIKEVRDLAGQTAVNYGVVRDGVTAEFFKQSEDEDFKKMWQAMQPNMLATVKDGVDRVKRENGTFAFIMESMSARYWTEKDCDLVSVGTEELNNGQYALATKKNSGLTEKLSDAINSLKEDGTIKELEDKWWNGDCTGAAPILAAHPLVVFVMAILIAAWQQR